MPQQRSPFALYDPQYVIVRQIGNCAGSGLQRRRIAFTQKRVDRYTKKIGKLRQQFDIGIGQRALPFADCLYRNSEFFRKLFLAHSAVFPEFPEIFRKCTIHL